MAKTSETETESAEARKKDVIEIITAAVENINYEKLLAGVVNWIRKGKGSRRKQEMIYWRSPICTAFYHHDDNFVGNVWLWCYRNPCLPTFMGRKIILSYLTSVMCVDVGYVWKLSKLILKRWSVNGFEAVQATQHFILKSFHVS